jgi:hypothetical protein
MNNNPVPSDRFAAQTSRRVFPVIGTPLANVIGDPAHRLFSNCRADFSPMIEHVLSVKFTER